jgi:hypothetical protein
MGDVDSLIPCLFESAIDLEAISVIPFVVEDSIHGLAKGVFSVVFVLEPGYKLIAAVMGWVVKPAGTKR